MMVMPTLSVQIDWDQNDTYMDSNEDSPDAATASCASPRGVRKEAVDGWERELAPSAELLRAFRAERIEWAQALEDARLDQEVGAVIVPVAVQPP